MSEHEDVPECPPPSDDEFEGSPDDSSVAGMSVAASVASDACSLLPQEDVQELINQSLSQGGMIGSHGATAQPQDDTMKGARQLKGRHSLKDSNVLFRNWMPN